MKLEEVIKTLGIPIRLEGEHHHARSGWLQTDCPWCSPDSERFRLGINIQHGYTNCWSCGKKGLIEVLGAITKKNYGDLRKLLKDVEKQEAPERREHTGTLKIPKGNRPLLQCHRDYLRQRGLRPHTIERLWGVQGYGAVGGLHWRILIPISYNGRVCSWTSRTISPNEPKRYWSAKPEEESIPHKDILYGIDYARHAIVICEGPIDVWSIGPAAVATLGLSYTAAQVASMSKFLVRCICFDNEPTAQRRAQQLCDQLSVFDGKTYNITLSDKDANETLLNHPQEIIELRKRFLDG